MWRIGDAKAKLQGFCFRLIASFSDRTLNVVQTGSPEHSWKKKHCWFAFDSSLMLRFFLQAYMAQGDVLIESSWFGNILMQAHSGSSFIIGLAVAFWRRNIYACAQGLQPHMILLGQKSRRCPGSWDIKNTHSVLKSPHAAFMWRK